LPQPLQRASGSVLRAVSRHAHPSDAVLLEPPEVVLGRRRLVPDEAQPAIAAPLPCVEPPVEQLAVDEHVNRDVLVGPHTPRAAAPQQRPKPPGSAALNRLVRYLGVGVMRVVQRMV
jgi:hypothetical protein